jgi:hypothetical protein
MYHLSVIGYEMVALQSRLNCCLNRYVEKGSRMARYGQDERGELAASIVPKADLQQSWTGIVEE